MKIFKKSLFIGLTLLASTLNVQATQLIKDADLKRINYKVQQKGNCLTHNMTTILNTQGIIINEEEFYEYAKGEADEGGYDVLAVDFLDICNIKTDVIEYDTMTKDSLQIFVAKALSECKVIGVTVSSDDYYNIPENRKTNGAHYITIIGETPLDYLVLDTNYKCVQNRSKDTFYKYVLPPKEGWLRHYVTMDLDDLREFSTQNMIDMG